MLRTEGLGSEAQKYLTQESIEDRKDFITMLIKKSNFKIFDPKECPDAKFLNGLRDALHFNDINLFNERFKPAAEGIKNMWQQIRTVAINHWGVIKQGTYESRTNKELFEDLKKHKPDEDIFDWAISKLEKMLCWQKMLHTENTTKLTRDVTSKKKNKSMLLSRRMNYIRSSRKLHLIDKKRRNYNSICVPSIIL